MERVVIFSDIHANLPALEAALEDMDRRGYGTEERYCLGDLVGYATFPNEVTQTIRERQIPCIMGNYDEGVGNNSDECGCAYKDARSEALGKLSIAWSNRHTTEENKEYLRSLPARIPLQLGELRVMLVHGSPRRINEYLYEDRPDRHSDGAAERAGVFMNEQGIKYVPHLLPIVAGTKVIFKSGDPELHNIYARGQKGVLFNTRCYHHAVAGAFPSWARCTSRATCTRK